MKKYFIAYRFTGETPAVLEERLSLVVSSLGRAGVEAYCNLFDQHEYEKAQLGPRQIMEKAFAKIDESDGLLVLIASDDKSEGQIMEVGYAFAKNKPIVAAVKAGVNTYVDAMANQAIYWEDLPDLQAKLEGLAE